MYAALVNLSKYFYAKGLLVFWREGLQAQNALLGKTKGYENQPQLMQFKITHNSSAAIACYLKKTPKRLIEEIIISKN
ncbi:MULTISPECIES: pyrimidine dimer DNA glycosylase/endonuclease V [Nitrosomonas]|uniref:Uncharacterized protein n=1 Tax=Nitrosomonas communis TaxID=44574 RepID=A0A5D3Y667_9PROT|nr:MULTISPECIES: pyrimidine dimer DNA glycosylase/endonuclease V [Nitrosomonas]TYP69481.1 hypothetical protein BCL69_11473 [Nitrosomonas communis]UVS61484.1 pyrimidine dimer DNA glycosylase/endonuclease V [Nitrosomonas sp. PLL12]